MTWKSHCLANGAVAMVLTARPEVALAAMLTSTLPDQLEALLPFGKHRGASHWIALWLGLLVAVPVFLQGNGLHHDRLILRPIMHEITLSHFFVATLFYGMALGPFLHVLLDGCSDSGVPVAPFSRRTLKLGLYRTHCHRWRWDLSEMFFLCGLLAICLFAWKMKGALATVWWLNLHL